jgi:transcriptional regulator of acetoin/glycerol metabolism
MTESETLERIMDSRKKTIETIMHKYLGVSIKELSEDITTKLHDPLLDFHVHEVLYKKAKKVFVKRYIIRMLTKHLGNISEAAREAGIDRRTIHRMIHEFKIDVDSIRNEMVSKTYLAEMSVNSVIEDSLKKYEEYLHPTKMHAMYKNVSTMTKDILDHLSPEHTLTLKQAELEFDRRFILRALAKNNNNISQTARQIGLRYETLHRKIKYIKRHLE